MIKIMYQYEKAPEGLHMYGILDKELARLKGVPTFFAYTVPYMENNDPSTGAGMTAETAGMGMMERFGVDRSEIQYARWRRP